MKQDRTWLRDGGASRDGHAVAAGDRGPERRGGRFVMESSRKRLAFLVVFWALVAVTVVIPANAQADSNCGASGGHTLCVTVPSGPLSGDVMVNVTNSPNSGLVFGTWMPSGGRATQLIEMYESSPASGDYSFIWPTTKYLDGSGTLSVQAGSTGSAAVMISVTLSNGNSTVIRRTSNDWASYLPGPWTGPNDPTILAVGDGASNEAASNAVANRVATIDPPLFLYLGDVYQSGTYTEFRNHYGESALDVSGAGTLWGATADVTQPTLGNHEKANSDAYIDYWHQRPLFTQFTFGGVLFLDLNSNGVMDANSAQYALVQNALTAPDTPDCIVAYSHHPAVTSNTEVFANETAMWQLLANNGADLLLTGHQHHSVEFKPLDANFNAGTPTSHLVQLVEGTGGHEQAGSGPSTSPGARVAWSKGTYNGLLALTLNGAAGDNAATGIAWKFEDLSGNTLRSGSVTCKPGNQPPIVDAGPDQAVKLPNQVTIQGSVSDDGLPNPPATVTSSWSQVSGPGTATFSDSGSPTTNVSFDAAGTYGLQLTGNDSALQASDDVTVTVLPEGATTLTVPIAASADDAEQSGGTVALSNKALKIVLRSGVNQTVGMRFAGLSIPQGATIHSAYIQFQCNAKTIGAASLMIEGQAADNPTTFKKTTNNISSRPRTTANVAWVPAPWATVGAHGSDEQTPDLTSVIQELVNRAGWGSGNAMVFIITGTGVRTAESFNGTFAPVLHVDYS